jgi:hypothetical protein
MMCDVCVLVFFVVSGVAPAGFSEFAGNIINLGINTNLSRKLLTSNPDKKIGQTIVIFSGQRSTFFFFPLSVRGPTRMRNSTGLAEL